MGTLVKHSLLFFAMLVLYSVVFEQKPTQAPIAHTHTSEERELLREFHREVILAEINREEVEPQVIQVAGQ